MGSAAKALSGLGVEYTNSGLQQRLTPTAVGSLPAGLSTGIPGTSANGERMAVQFYNHTATGTITIAGKNAYAQGAATETSSTIPLAELPGEVIWYVTSQVYSSVTASTGVSVTGLTGGTVAIFGIQAATRLIPGETKLSDKWKEYSPKEQRGTFEENYHLLATSEDPEWEFTSDFYADVSLFGFLGGYASDATVATIPTVPVVILTASQSIATSGNASATNQPTVPGMVIQIVLNGTAPTSAATVSITGTNVFGETVTEVVVPSTIVQGTWVSSNIFKTIASNGIAWGTFGTGATMNVTGNFGYSYSNSGPSDNLQTFALEQYDSTASYVAPYCLVNEWGMEGGAEKEAKFTAKGPCQQVLPVGNPATTTNQITAFSLPLDKPLSGWRAIATIDALSGTIGTTQTSALIEWKLAFKTNWKPLHTSWGNPPTRNWARAYRNRRSVEVEMTLDMDTTTFQNEYQAWKRRQKRLVQIWLKGPFLGNDTSDFFEGVKVNLALRWVDVAERDYSTGKESVQVKLKGLAEYETTLGYSNLVTWYSRIKQW